MFLVVFVLTGLGLCTAQDPKTAHLLQPRNVTAENTIKVLQTNSTLRLDKISAKLASQVCTCLHSDFLEVLEIGAKRTLTCYLNQNSIGNPIEAWAQLTTNVTILVNNDPADQFAVINVWDPQHKLPERWEEYYELYFATQFCFIIKTTYGKTRSKVPCVLFKLDSATRETSNECYKWFEQKCESATPFLEDSKKCNQIAQKAKKQR